MRIGRGRRHREPRVVAGGEIAGHSTEQGGEFDEQGGQRLPARWKTGEKNACELVDAFGNISQCTRGDVRRTV